MEARDEDVAVEMAAGAKSIVGNGTIPRHSVPRAVAPQDVPEGAPLDHPTLFFNRELSWLDFNWRVLSQALDDRSPLLERIICFPLQHVAGSSSRWISRKPSTFPSSGPV